MSWPNPTHVAVGVTGVTSRPLVSTDPQWRPVVGKSGIWVHDDDPTRQVEIIAYSCPACFEKKTVYMSVTEVTPQERGMHATCQGCKSSLQVISQLDVKGEPQWLPRPHPFMKDIQNAISPPPKPISGSF